MTSPSNKVNFNTYFSAVKNSPSEVWEGVKGTVNFVKTRINKSKGPAGPEGVTTWKKAKIKHNLPISVNDYLGVFPVTQQVVGVVGIVYNVGWLAAVRFVKYLNPDTKASSVNYEHRLKHSVLRTIPVIGTLFSLKRFENENSSVVCKTAHSDIGDRVADVFSILPIVQQAVGAGGMLWNSAKMVGNVVKRIFYRNNADKTPELKESAQRHKVKFFVNLVRFTPLIGTVLSIQRLTVNIRNK